MSKFHDWLMKKTIRRAVYTIIIAVIVIFASLLIGPMDHFAHGYFSDESWYASAAASENMQYVDLGNQNYEIEFQPAKKHFAGFEILLTDNPENSNGTLKLIISDNNGKGVEEIDADLSKIRNNVFYKVNTKSELKQDTIYKLTISAMNCSSYPKIMLSDSTLLPKELISGDLMIGYSYAESTFIVSTKALIISYIIAFGALFISIGLKKEKAQKYVRYFSSFVIVVAALSWNYMYSSMDNQNTKFGGFQGDSESLVINLINASYDSVYSKKGYHLGWYYKDEQNDFVTDEHWIDGYSVYDAIIALQNNGYVNTVAVSGNAIIFPNGAQYTITGADVGEQYTNIHLDSDHILSKDECGDLSGIKFSAPNGTVYDHKIFVDYESQYGLQGKVFRKMSRFMDHDNAVEVFHLLCCVGTALVFLIISLLIKYKYNTLMAVCFITTFWLSPWTVNYARNLYWVEFTWFLPMMFGIICSLKTSDKKIRIFSYFGAFVSVFVKSLCGYEYLSTIMLAMISLLCTDLITALVKKNGKEAALVFRTTVLMGVFALLGFTAAICIHGSMRGDGNIGEGIRSIIEKDVLRRTSGADYNDYIDSNPLYLRSFNASTWYVFCTYFQFSTEIILGLTGNLFPLLCTIPLVIFANDIKKSNPNYKQMTLYGFFFATTVSWYILAKGHSYIHTPLNFVLWYFGFIQICFYIILDKAAKLLKIYKKENTDV